MIRDKGADSSRLSADLLKQQAISVRSPVVKMYLTSKKFSSTPDYFSNFLTITVAL